jgi:hypothetical protein
MSQYRRARKRRSEHAVKEAVAQAVQSVGKGQEEQRNFA